MNTLRRVGITASVFSALLLLSSGFHQAQEGPLAPPKHDAAVLRDALRHVINVGADLFNVGDHAGCYRLYQGALMAVKPFLGPDMQADVVNAMIAAEKMPKIADRAFALRKVIDAVRAQAGPAAPLTPKMPPKVIIPAAPDADKAPKSALTLWERLGGAANVRKVVSDLMMSARTDPKVNFSRDGKYKLDEPTVQFVEQQLVDFISSATGGPFKYQGKSMKEVHRGMGITAAEYDALKQHIQRALEKSGAKAGDIAEVMKAVEGLRKEIVEAGD